MKYLVLIFITGLGILATGCSSGCITVTPPDINMTGKQTVIERQIVGDYKEIEKDAWVISSANSSKDNSRGKMTKIGGNKTFLAMKIRELHSEKIRKYKDEAVVGEKYDGYISYIKIKKYEKNSNLKDILNQVVLQENKARKTIFVGTLKSILQKEPTKEQIAQMGREFAVEEKALAKSGDSIQSKNGRWEKK